MLLSMDFWTVKNITGRLLAGLRYWNYVDDAGNSHWIFESRKVRKWKLLFYLSNWEKTTAYFFIKGSDKNHVSSIESNIFWLSLVFTIILWIILTIATLFSPTYIVNNIVFLFYVRD